MAEHYIPNFMGGLNVAQHPTKIKDSELQLLENMEVRPTNISNTISYFELTARQSYKRLHTDVLLFIPRNLIEFVQSIAGGLGIGTKFLVTGGFESPNFRLRYLQDGATTTTQISSTASSSTARLSMFIYNQFLYYTDGNVAWRSWNGVTDAASGFITRTKTGVMHKFRAFYGNDVTNTLPNRLYYSDVGLPETVVATSYFDIGDRNDAIINVVDQVERLLIIKEKSSWVLYLDATPANSTLLKVETYKGSTAQIGAVYENTGVYVSTLNDGIQRIVGNRFEPSFLQIYNQLKGFQNPLAALGWNEDQVLLATLATSASTYNDRVYAFDLFGTKVFQSNLNFSSFCMNRGIFTFGGKLKATEDDGTNRYIVELDRISSPVETTFTCKMRTKEFALGAIDQINKLEGITFSGIFPDNTTALTIKTFKDGGTSALETKTYTPTTAGFNRKRLSFLESTSFGNYISVQFEYAQPASNAIRFSILDLLLDYDKESRKE